MADQWRGLDDKTKKEYNEKAKEKRATMDAEGKLVPKRKKKKKSDDTFFIIADSLVTSAGKIFVNLIVVN